MSNHRLPNSDSAAQHAAWRKRVYLHGPVLVDATGTHRRLQALAAAGWSVPAIERYAGVRRWKFDDVLNSKRVHRETAELIRRVYDELWSTPAPAGVSSARAKVAARKNGWPMPAAWDDDEIDNPDAEPQWFGRCPRGHMYNRVRVRIKSNGREYRNPECDTCAKRARAERVSA